MGGLFCSEYFALLSLSFCGSLLFSLLLEILSKRDLSIASVALVFTCSNLLFSSSKLFEAFILILGAVSFDSLSSSLLSLCIPCMASVFSFGWVFKFRFLFFMAA
uniref:Uncharacterized protein n=1 Tax=Cacopsylla melanoneura TaxID=428564 RepID=A0A8D8TTQ1_9HEMI